MKICIPLERSIPSSSYLSNWLKSVVWQRNSLSSRRRLISTSSSAFATRKFKSPNLKFRCCQHFIGGKSEKRTKKCFPPHLCFWLVEHYNYYSDYLRQLSSEGLCWRLWLFSGNQQHGFVIFHLLQVDWVFKYVRGFFILRNNGISIL